MTPKSLINLITSIQFCEVQEYKKKLKNLEISEENVKNPKISEENVKNLKITEAKYRIIGERKRFSNPEISDKSRNLGRKKEKSRNIGKKIRKFRHPASL